MVPVQGYNIKERITRANEQLLESPALQRSHEPRVTFHERLENFEPDSDDGYVDSFEVDASSNSESETSKKDILNENVSLINEDMINSEIIEENIEDNEHSLESVVLITNKTQNDDSENIVDTLRSLSIKDDTYYDENQSFEYASDVCGDFDSSSDSEPNVKVIQYNDTLNKNKTNERLSLTLCNGNFRRRIQQPTPVLKLKYRYCCEHDISKQQKLPQYNGLKSEYGLSEIQLQLKAERQEKLRNNMLLRRKLRVDNLVKHSLINEYAFASWLKTKLSKKKTCCNMYK